MERQRPRLILLDLMMPEMDGFEFVVRVRDKPEWRLIPIVVLTAHDLSLEERRRLNGHVETILHKSGDSREALLQQLRDFLEDHHCGAGYGYASGRRKARHVYLIHFSESHAQNFTSRR